MDASNLRSLFTYCSSNESVGSVVGNAPDFSSGENDCVECRFLPPQLLRSADAWIEPYGQKSGNLLTSAISK
jgi:hypothetical protein